MKKIYHGLVAKINNHLYRVKNTKKGLILSEENKKIEEAEEVFYLSYHAIFEGIEVFIDEIEKNQLNISFETRLELKKFNYEEFERGFGRMIVSFEDCEEVFVKKTPFKDYPFKNTNKETFQSYSELEQSAFSSLK